MPGLQDVPLRHYQDQASTDVQGPGPGPLRPRPTLPPAQGHAPGFGAFASAVVPPPNPRVAQLTHALAQLSGNMAAPVGRFLADTTMAAVPHPLATMFATPIEYARRLQHALVGSRDPQTRSPSEALTGPAPKATRE